jgi:hypothetical protein
MRVNDLPRIGSRWIKPFQLVFRVGRPTATVYFMRECSKMYAVIHESLKNVKYES